MLFNADLTNYKKLKQAKLELSGETMRNCKTNIVDRNKNYVFLDLKFKVMQFQNFIARVKYLYDTNILFLFFIFLVVVK